LFAGRHSGIFESSLKTSSALFSEYRRHLDTELLRLKKNPVFLAMLERMRVARRERRTVYLCGNGGSAANANHFATDLLFGLEKDPGPIWRVISLSANISLLTCLGNDTGFENIFSKQLEATGQRGDLLLAYSGSGNSPNILRALEVARGMGITSLAFLGFDGGKAKELADLCLHFPVHDMQIAEDLHMMASHLLLRSL
jgi:D-sedoheptulose 7-phosphate isomerase